MIPASVYAQLGREKKMLRLVMALDGALTTMNVDPFSAAALEYVLSMSPNAWRIAAAHAGVPLASLTTQHMIEDVYRRRIEIRAALNSIPLRAVAR